MTTNGAGTGEWRTSVSADEVASSWRDLGSRGGRAVVVTHAKPDGDAIGSTTAAARTLARLGAQVETWYIGPLPRWAGQVVGAAGWRVFAPGGAACTPADGRPWPPDRDPDLVVIVDTGSWAQLAELRPWLELVADRTVVIDHHAHGSPDLSSRRIVEVSCAAATQVLAPICVAALGARSAADLPREIAEPLYLGLATDTGWFRFSSVTPATMRLAGDLLAAGVDHPRLYQMIEQQDEIGRWKLLGRALSGVRLFPIPESRGGGTASVMRLTVRDFQESHADRNDTGGFADMVLTVAGVRASFVLSEQEVAPGERPLTKVSVRSKPGSDAIDVNQAMQRLGGGGHARAAGAKIRAGLDEAERMVLETVR